LSSSSIDKYIDDLRKEQEKIEDIYNKLAKFLYINAIHPVNDDIIGYFQFFIREERMKYEAGAKNEDVINNLTKIMTKYESDMDSFKKIASMQEIYRILKIHFL
jgi:hypothetical protein